MTSGVRSVLHEYGMLVIKPTRIIRAALFGKELSIKTCRTSIKTEHAVYKGIGNK